MKWRFAGFEFDPDGPGLVHDGKPVALEPQALHLLSVLIENRDRIVTREELVDIVWNGRAITDAALSTRIRSLRRVFGDDRNAQEFIKTYPRRGFQFVARIETAAPVYSNRTRTRGAWMPAWLVILAAGAITFWLAFAPSNLDAPKPPDRPTVAVMPLRDLSPEPQARYWSDGLTSDLVSHLSRFSELFVISSASTSAYGDARIEPSRIAAELGITYLVNGTVLQDSTRLRVSVELLNARRGELLWAESFDRAQTDIFELQHSVSRAIAGQLVPELIEADSRQATDIPTRDQRAWDFYLQALSAQSVYASESQARAETLARQAIALDPDFGMARSLLARVLGTRFFFRWTEDPGDTLAQAISEGERALDLGANDPVAHAALGYIYRFTGDADLAISHLERARNLNPNDARIRLELAHTLDWFRLQERALPEIEMAISLSPRDPLLHMMYFYKGHILFHLKRYRESLDAAETMRVLVKDDVWRVLRHLLRAANLAELGQAKDAGNAIDAALAINPKLSLTAMRKQFEDSKNHPENRRIWLESLEKAGLPAK